MVHFFIIKKRSESPWLEYFREYVDHQQRETWVIVQKKSKFKVAHFVIYCYFSDSKTWLIYVCIQCTFLYMDRVSNIIPMCWLLLILNVKWIALEKHQTYWRRSKAGWSNNHGLYKVLFIAITFYIKLNLAANIQDYSFSLVSMLLSKILCIFIFA